MALTDNFNGKFRCACCGYFTLPRQADNTFEICPVCYWEDDGIQLSQPDYSGGANSVSLTEAKENFLKFGVSDKLFREYVRPPKKDELGLKF